MSEPIITKEVFDRLFEEYVACIDVDIEDELEAWSIEWEALEDVVLGFVKTVAAAMGRGETEPFSGLCTIAYVFYALGVKSAMEVETVRQAKQGVDVDTDL